jgi:uncharacterized sulfatase
MLMPTRRAFLSSAAAPFLARAQKQNYNVLFIAADDLRNALGCYGHPLVKSPNIDRLAGRGVRFDRAYCQFPLCGPSRTSLLSGLRPDSTRILTNGIAIRETVPDAVTLPEFFRKRGYRSVRLGKMYHMDVPASVGTNKYDDPASWDVSVSPPGLEDKTPGEGRNITAKQGLGNAFKWVSFRGDGKDQADDSAAAQAVDLIHKQKDQPFFLGLGFLRPHVPHVAPARFFDLYPLSSIQPVRNPPNDHGHIPKASEIAINTRANDMGMNEADKREAIRGYYASISYMDWQVGRVLDALDKSGAAARSVIVFWSDHGWHLGEHHRWHKRSLFEESARVPLIVSAPGGARGKASRALVELIDLYPTVTDLCGFAPPSHVEGQSLEPLLRNPDRPWKTAAFTQVTAPDGIVGRAVRTDRYRYIRWEGPHPDEELYDHQTDPSEHANLAHDKASAPLVKQMQAILEAGWRGARAKV